MSESSKSWFWDSTQYSDWHFARIQRAFIRDAVVLGGLGYTIGEGSRSITIASGEAVIRGYHYDNSASIILSIPAAHSAYDRIDRAVIALNMSGATVEYNQRAVKHGEGKVVLKQGTAQASPVAPALTQDFDGQGIYELPLVRFTVKAGATNEVDIDDAIDDRVYVSKGSASSVDFDVTSYGAVEPLDFVHVALSGGSWDAGEAHVTRGNVAKRSVQAFVLGPVLAAALANNTVKVRLAGIASDYSGLTPGAIQRLASVQGELVEEDPSSIERAALAIDANQVLIAHRPSNETVTAN